MHLKRQNLPEGGVPFITGVALDKHHDEGRVSNVMDEGGHTLVAPVVAWVHLQLASKTMGKLEDVQEPPAAH